MKKKFKMWVVTPQGDKLYYSTCGKVETMKATVEKLRAQLHWGYAILCEGPNNSMRFGCYRPMTDATVIQTLDLVPALRKRVLNLKVGNVQIVDVVPLPAPTPASMRTRLSQRLNEWNDSLKEYMTPRNMGAALFLPKPVQLLALPPPREALLQKQREMFPYARGVLDHYDLGARGPVSFPEHHTLM